MVTKAQMKATQKYEAKTYDRYYLRFRKEAVINSESIHAAADAAGESVNQYIIKAIEDRMKKEGRI